MCYAILYLARARLYCIWHLLGCTVPVMCYALLYLARARLYCTWHVRDCSVPGMFQGLFLHVIRWRVGQQLVQRDDIAGDLHTSTSVNRFLIINLMEPAFPKRPDGIGFYKSTWWNWIFQIDRKEPAISNRPDGTGFSKSTYCELLLKLWTVLFKICFKNPLYNIFATKICCLLSAEIRFIQLTEDT